MRTKITNIKQLQLIANTVRQDVINMLEEAKSGHSAGSIGLADIFTALWMSLWLRLPFVERMVWRLTFAIFRT